MSYKARSRRGPRESRHLAASSLIVVLLAGCGGGQVQYPVQVDKAEDTLRVALDGWKSGKKPDDLKDATPSIVVQDIDWNSGLKLVEYEVQPGGKPQDANLVASVKLKLQDDKGKATDKTVTYLVGTEPVLTVFRDMFR